MRVDAIVSSCFGLSRNKVCKLVDRGEVLIDWKVIRNSALPLRVGQVVSVQGKMGKLLVQDVKETNNGRFKVNIVKTS
jgi:RNA-binding protein YlmH